MRDISQPELVQIQRASWRAIVGRYTRAFASHPPIQSAISSLGRAAEGDTGGLTPEELADVIARREAKAMAALEIERRAAAVERGIRAGRAYIMRERAADPGKAALATLVRDLGAAIEAMAQAEATFRLDGRGRVSVEDKRGQVISGLDAAGRAVWHPDAVVAARAVVRERRP